MGMFEGSVVEVATIEFHEESVAIMDFWAEIERFGVGAFAEPEHRGEWDQSELLDWAAEGDFGLDVDDS